MGGERGRPRGFDVDAALDRALEVFWRHGFRGASMAELTAAMGLAKPSVYAAFGDKEALYLKALERYATIAGDQATAALDGEADGRRAVEAYLRAMVRMVSDPAQPGGCFVVTGTADCGGATTPPAVEAALRQALLGGEARLRARLERAREEGQLAAGTSVDALAGFYAALLAGLAVMAKGGAAQARLDTVIATAMAAWPGPQEATGRRGPGAERGR